MAIQRSPLRRPTRTEARRAGVLLNTVLKPDGDTASAGDVSFDPNAFDVGAFDPGAFFLEEA